LICRKIGTHLPKLLSNINEYNFLRHCVYSYLYQQLSTLSVIRVGVAIYATVQKLHFTSQRCDAKKT